MLTDLACWDEMKVAELSLFDLGAGKDVDVRSIEYGTEQSMLDRGAPGAIGALSSWTPARHTAQIVVQPSSSRTRPLRIGLYSHDTMGLGHMRRNVLVAESLVSPSLQPAILMVAGARAANAFALPRGMDCLTLPALRKDLDGKYQARCLDVSLQELIALRSKTIRAALEAFEPDVLIVDNVPRGAVKELEPTLEYLRQHGRARCVLGLRDVLDEPEVVHREWSHAANEDAIRDFYDAVWVYGDPVVYDPVREYRFSTDVAAKVSYTGYLDQSLRLKFSQGNNADLLAGLALPPGRLVLCLVGGGQDGAQLAEAFAEADLPPETNGVILTGPFMPLDAQARLQRRVAMHPRLRVVDFLAEPTRLLQLADRVISMGGYNTICEILSFEKHALVVPRHRPRREQLIRAERLRDLGLLDVLHPDDVSPRALSDWLHCDLDGRSRVFGRVDLNGLVRLPRLLEEVLNGTPDQECRQLYQGGHRVAVG